MKKIIVILLMITLTGCQSNPKGSDQSQFAWQIFAKENKIVAQLSTVNTLTHYDGTSEDVTVKQDAPFGKTYVLIHLQIKKENPGGSMFMWDKLSLTDAEKNTYQRIDDAFLDSHKLDRMTQLDIRLGSSEGWIAFLIPLDQSKSALTLIYQADEGENKVIIHP